MPDQLPLPSTELVHDSQGWGEEPEPEASPHLVAEVDIEASDGPSSPDSQTSQEVEVVQEARNDEEVPHEPHEPHDPVTRLEPPELAQAMSIKSELENFALIITTWVMQLESREQKGLIANTLEPVQTLQMEVATLCSVVDSLTTNQPFLPMRSRVDCERAMLYIEDKYLNVRVNYDRVKALVLPFLDAPARADLKRSFSALDL